jgi:hypothetical protein
MNLATAFLSVALGLCWSALAMALMGAGPREMLQPVWLLSGAVAGVAVGWFTVWSRSRRDGSESLLSGIATFYLGTLVYWACFVAIERARLCWRAGGWTDFDLDDHLRLLALFLLHGTVTYGIVLLPLCFLSRHVVWSLHRRSKA